MNFPRALVVCAALAATLLLSGCLNMEYKIYRCKLNPDGSGSGSITFVGFFSTPDDGKDASASDFEQLTSDYLNGSKFEDETPRIHVTGKRLYEENGKLCGEITYDFTHADSAGFILSKGCPVLFIPGDNETIVESNGTISTAAASYISWPGGTTDLWYKVDIASDDTTDAVPLLNLYRAWKSGGKKE